MDTLSPHHNQLENTNNTSIFDIISDKKKRNEKYQLVEMSSKQELIKKEINILKTDIFKIMHNLCKSDKNKKNCEMITIDKSSSPMKWQNEESGIILSRIKGLYTKSNDHQPCQNKFCLHVAYNQQKKEGFMQVQYENETYSKKIRQTDEIGFINQATQKVQDIFFSQENHKHTSFSQN